ncbi:MAG: class I SAM-dependent methyltransferase [Anaerolineaceae bacterium]|jgi:cyclopropane fatty-acyl-phospholipid synthase-like methyltransferase|nr:MAG: class I SAM-dependent methyltransferase [Anaerolineaceae bacterium]
MTNPKSKSAAYWEEHLKSWEAGAYYKEGRHNANWWDRLSSVFRGDAMYVRMNTALELLAPHVKGTTVLDVGCASGRFVFQLINAGAQKVYGTDISNEILELAKSRSIELGVQDKTDFSVMDVVQPNSPLPQVDVVTALGVIEYFDAKDMSAFLGNLRTKYFLLDFPDHGRKKEFPTWVLRQVYIRVNRLPGVYLYSLDEFAKIAEPLGFSNLRVIEKNNFYYVTNLPA